MPDLSAIIQHGASNPWLYVPFAILLGALHALEPGHSKSLMAGFIVAIKGTPKQAALLGLSAAVGHTIIVWALAVAGFMLGDKLLLTRAEPWLVLVSGLLIMALAFRLLWSVLPKAAAHHHHDHDHPHDHDHLDDDAHAAAHAGDIETRFANRRNISNGEIAWFGFTGGLLPCPSAVAVLLVCLQLRQFTLGLVMVGAFSLGLAATMVAVGVIAAWGTKHAAARWSGFDTWSARIPYASAAIVMLLGVAVTLRGLWELGVFGVS